MAGNEAKDDIDSAVAKALADALVEARQDTSRLTKGARIRRHAEAIQALKEQRWSWEQIARRLSDGGLKVSARTVRLEMTKAPKGSEKAMKAGRSGEPSPARRGVPTRRPEAERETRPGKEMAKDTATPEEAPGNKATADGFFDAGEVEN